MYVNADILVPGIFCPWRETELRCDKKGFVHVFFNITVCVFLEEMCEKLV